MPSVKLRAPSAASCSPWSVCPLVQPEILCLLSYRWHQRAHITMFAIPAFVTVNVELNCDITLFPQENEHLQKFQVTWELHNKHLFENLVFSEPILHSSLPALVAQLK